MSNVSPFKSSVSGTVACVLTVIVGIGFAALGSGVKLSAHGSILGYTIPHLSNALGWISSVPNDVYSTIGTGLVYGGVVALVIFLAETKRDLKLHEITLEHAFRSHIAFSRNLESIDLSLRDLRGAVLRGKTLRSADLSHSNLERVDLRACDLRGADLRGANLTKAIFDSSDLRLANFSGATMCEAELNDVDGRGALFYGANLRQANLQGSNFDPLSAEEVIAIRQIGIRPIKWHYEPDEDEERIARFDRVDAYATDWRSSTAIRASFVDAKLTYSALGSRGKPQPRQIFGFWKFVGHLLVEKDIEMFSRSTNFYRLARRPIQLIGADLEGANLSYSDISGVIFTPPQVDVATLAGARGLEIESHMRPAD